MIKGFTAPRWQCAVNAPAVGRATIGLVVALSRCPSEREFRFAT
jgi:hypothetical protein